MAVAVERGDHVGRQVTEQVARSADQRAVGGSHGLVVRAVGAREHGEDREGDGVAAAGGHVLGGAAGAQRGAVHARRADVNDQRRVDVLGRAKTREPDRRGGCELTHRTITNTLFHSLTLSFLPRPTPCVERPLSVLAGHSMEINPHNLHHENTACNSLFYFRRRRPRRLIAPMASTVRLAGSGTAVTPANASPPPEAPVANG